MSNTKIPPALHDHLHEKGIYTHAGIQGAEVVFEWVITQLCGLPLDEAVEQLCVWYQNLLHDIK